MRYSTLNELQTTREMVDAFGGYNHNLRIGEGEFYDMKNLTSSFYPVLSPRSARKAYATPGGAQGLIAKDTLCYVDGEDFVMDGYPIRMGLSDGPKTLVSMGAYVIILPDKMWINTKDITEFGRIEASVTTAAPVSFELCKIDGSNYTADYNQGTEPSEPANMALWIDTSSVPHTLKQYSESTGTWVAIGTTYIKIYSAGIGAPFEQYDGVTISGLKDTVLHDNTTGEVIEDTSELAAIDGSFVIWDKGDNYIVIVGMLDVTRTIKEPVTVARRMPELDFVTESGNRLWGCRYGVAANGEVVNEIYACKLGDFKNWNCFMGVSTDSYVVTVGTDGQFTGAITHLGYPIFFKEGYLHKIYGNYPANYQVQTTACRGVQRGSEKSLAIVNEVLYYKSRQAVCAYDGSLPSEISSALGDVMYSNAVGGGHGNRYYVSMCDPGGTYHLFCYDAAKGMWHREDNTQVDAFCSCRDEMYYIDHEDGSIKIVAGGEDKVEWMAETGVIGITYPDRKYISRILLRMVLNPGTTVRVFGQYDSIGDWVPLCTLNGTSLRSFMVPIRPKRCDHMRLRIEGDGEAKLYSITKTIEQGSDY